MQRERVEPAAPVVERRARKLEAPPAPWAPLPLTEVMILLGMILVVIGFLRGADGAGPPLVAGFAFICLSGLELSLREHRAGYRSHSVLLAGAAALIGVQPFIFLVGLPVWVALLIAAVIFGPVLLLARAAFTRKTGGLGFRA